MNKKKLFLFTPWFMGVLFIVFAMAMAFATFYENDFGAIAARTIVYNTKWFELIMLLMIINLIGQTFIYKLYKIKKLSILLFHLAFVLIIVGAGITRYTGFEGVINIREGETQDICTSTDKYIDVKLLNQNGEEQVAYQKRMIINSITKESFKKKFISDDKHYEIVYKGFIPNASETVIEKSGGEPMVSFFFSLGMMGRENIILKQSDYKNIKGFTFSFSASEKADVRFVLENDTIKIVSDHEVSETSMMNKQTIHYAAGDFVEFKKMNIYKVRGFSIVPDKVTTSGVLGVVGSPNEMQKTNKSAMVFELVNQETRTPLYLWTGKSEINEIKHKIGENSLQIKYGALPVRLPFSIKLEDFILDRYPGSNSPSSYKSNVIVIDKDAGLEKSYSIYMNHILKYKGWRFYQSSYDQDEKGTILSVNKDFAGMVITYVGYFSLFLFIILSLLNKNSGFRTVSKRFFSSSAKKVLSVLFLLSLSFGAFAQINNSQEKFVVDTDQADKFGRILVQDQNGRTEPLYTLSNDILRKVSRKSQINGYAPMQVFLGLYFDFENWQKEPLIKVSNEELRNLINIEGEYAAFTDLVDLNSNTYKIKTDLDKAYAKPANKRTKFDKELIKINERVNICYMINVGEFMKIFPVRDSTYKWHSPQEAYQFVSNSEDSLYLRNIVALYAQGIQKGNAVGDFFQANEVLKSIITYQRNFAQYELPSDNKIRAEYFYYKSKLYDKLFPFYSTLGFILLIFLIYSVIAQKRNNNIIIKIFTGFLILGFIFHTLGLAIRWYISGHAPMSNGYESMIFISWVTILAGFIFAKRSSFVLAATSVLGGFTLMVAHLSYMDPQITNLVPVLQSYWLTLHVSIITGSYGFLGLGAIIGLIVMILYSLQTKINKAHLDKTIEELTIINYKTLTIGLYLLTIGTFLGAIWANESWGRYWGWDPKETWSLITIIVYSFVIHSRMIEGFKSFFIFNSLALYSFASVLMTYFGVNYYLSGLHSYAGGDPVPVPNFVYISIITLVLLSVVSYYRYKKINKIN